MTASLSTISRIEALERKMNRIEYLLWYVAGALSIQFGKEIMPMISAIIK